MYERIKRKPRPPIDEENTRDFIINGENKLLRCTCISVKIVRPVLASDGGAGTALWRGCAELTSGTASKCTAKLNAWT